MSVVEVGRMEIVRKEGLHGTEELAGSLSSFLGIWAQILFLLSEGSHDKEEILAGGKALLIGDS